MAAGGKERVVLEVPGLDGYEPDVGAALWRLEDTRVRTLRVLRELPDDQLDRDASGNTIGTVLYHIALIEADWLYTEILEEPISEEIQRLLPVEDRDAEGILTTVRGESLEQHLERLDIVRRDLLDRMRGMTVEEYNRKRELPNYDVSPAWVLHHLSQHEAEHRGEIASISARLRDTDAP